MECRDAQFYLRLRRHAADELGPDVTGALESHLATCPACAADARVAASFDRLMASAMKAVPVPAGLRDQLVRHVASKQGAIFRRKMYRVGSLAAAAIVLVALGLSIFSSARPRFDPNWIVQKDDELLGRQEEYARRWLAAQKLPERLPEDLDYDLLASCEVVEVPGGRVPMMLFRSPEGTGFAKVYIIREDGRFDLKDIQDAQGSHVGAQVLVGKDQFRGFTYVFVHTGGPNGLQPFRKTRRGPQRPA
jgi:hypothetical protein